MTIDAAVAWPRVNRRQKPARARKDEASPRSADVSQVGQALDRPVATFVVDGQEVVITTGDVAAVKVDLLRPHSEEAMVTVALADKINVLRQHLPPQVRERLFWENMEAIRAKAIADGTAIDGPMEAVVGD
ncbi:MAG: hypothetical protein NT169_13700 [Chloroflexi bacterium]|nr:hypothetical protein [Chloroflexota bacterium]